MRLLDYAIKPYPASQRKWAVMLAISLFISLFLLLFQPFGLQHLVSGRKFLLLAGYGLVTLVVLFLDMYIIPLMLPGLFKEENWTVFREIMLLLWIVMTISMSNYLYSVMVSIVHWAGVRGFLIFTGFTLAVAIIPITGVIVISHNALLRKNLRASRKLNQMIMEREGIKRTDEHIVLITSENKHQKIEVPAFNLVCIESEGNYVNAWFVEEGKIRRILLRNTIMNIGKQVLDAENLFKCHRAFIINLSHVVKITGNSQGYRLRLKFLDREIPVARSYSKSFREAISKNP